MSQHSRGATPRSRLRKALRLIAGDYCSRFTTGPGACLTTNRTKDAYYTDERWCDQCIAFWGLGRKGKKK